MRQCSAPKRKVKRFRLRPLRKNAGRRPTARQKRGRSEEGCSDGYTRQPRVRLGRSAVGRGLSNCLLVGRITIRVNADVRSGPREQPHESRETNSATWRINMARLRFHADSVPNGVQGFRDTRQDAVFNQVFQKLLIYAAGSGVSSGQ